MASVATESRREVDRQELSGAVLVGLPFEVKADFSGGKYLEYMYPNGQPMTVYDYLPVFAPIVRLLEQYRDLERHVTLAVKEKDEAVANAAAAVTKLTSAERLIQKLETEKKNKAKHE